MSIHREKRSKAAKAVIFDYGEVLCHRPTAEEIARRGRPAPFAPRAGKSPPQSAKDSLCAPWRNDGARITQSVFLRLKSSKKTCAHSTSRQLRLRDYSHRYRRMGDGGRRLGVLLGTAGGQGIHCSDSRGARCGRQLDRYRGRVRTGALRGGRRQSDRGTRTPSIRLY
jgi:hypothetical protein